MPWARASALDRHLECSAASWLSREDRGKWSPGYLAERLVVPAALLSEPPSRDGTMAEWGTQMHLAKEDLSKAADPWLSWMEPHRSVLWPDHLGRHEVPWAFCCDTGKVVLWKPKDGDKDEWKRTRGPSFVTGTTDWWGAIPSGEPWVDDLKTGWPVPGLTTPQMLMYALVAARVADHPSVRISVTHWRRGWEDPERRWQQVGPATLDAFEEELRAAYRRTLNDPSPRAGAHCRWCPSAAVCPAVTGEQE